MVRCGRWWRQDYGALGVEATAIEDKRLALVDEEALTIISENADRACCC